MAAIVDERGGLPGDEDWDLVSCAETDFLVLEGPEEAEPDLGSAVVVVTAEDPTDTLEFTGEIAETLGIGGEGEGLGDESPLSSSRKLRA